ncbi:High-affnity carbon uptake protein Hat/HatR [Crocosphaera watsonii WH 0402]|uniref:High-affnity carbon uptake protein Hat/HatR n=1 Tax=Crocosphaera watsonii WH 0402 TaxID=1284629 RepID=T2JXP9_CROWT|nr:AAA-like domain-containing protein [Crocosphaera watsonii]CCQ70583.1 High-affnity carbon uptake protein Hat/HatR [Crocosphaera watsonii WH 0402]
MKSNFYQVGGTLGSQHPTYVEREADESLYQGLKDGEFCYVLNPRQMGKSSLADRTMQRLKNEDYACAFIDLTNDIGIAATADEWYYSLADSINRKFKIHNALSNWWDEYPNLSALGRFREFIETIILKEIDKKIVIFIDEINNVRCQLFSLDDFFAFIRSCYNSRINQPQYQRLTFAIFGVATPRDLIQDSNQTPFNIGTEIELRGFQLEKVKPLIQGLKEKANNPQAVMEQILYWTGGQPFLTQKLCKLVTQIDRIIAAGSEKKQIENLVQSKIIDNWQQQDNPEHLRTIEQKIFQETPLSKSLLILYEEILESGEVKFSGSQQEIVLMVSGLVVKQKDVIKPYNLIYQLVFNLQWVKQRLTELRPYSDQLLAWQHSDFQDNLCLLQGSELEKALIWSSGQNEQTLDELDLEFLSASQAWDKKQRNKKIIKFSSLGFLAGLVTFSLITYAHNWYKNYNFQYCSVLEKVGDTCFRNVFTSGEAKLFLSRPNHYLDRGIEKFKEKEYEDAINLLERAIISAPKDPVPQIFYNNAQARRRSDKINKERGINNPLLEIVLGKEVPYKFAAVIPADSNEGIAIEILKGVADAQTAFNKKGGKNDRLLEIVLVNDGDEPESAQRIAKDIASDGDILAVIGHYSSDTTGKSLEEYDRAILPMVSPTSVSSKVDEKRQELTHKVFFRTVPSDRQIETLAKYIKDSLKLDTAVVFYEKASEFYSQSGREVFIREYEKIGGKVDKNGDGVIDIRDDESQQNFNDENVRLDSLALNAEEKLKKILNQKKLRLLL